MNREEIQQKLKEAKEVRTNFNTMTDEYIADLESQLAEEKPKLKLRHGVCAVNNEKRKSFVVLEQSTMAGSPKAFYGNGGGQIEADKNIKDYTVLIPNIFEYLAAMAKEVRDYRNKSLRMIISEGIIGISIQGCYCYFKRDEAKEIHQQLGALLYTAKKEGSGK